MGDILVHIETRASAIQPVSLELLTAARELASALGLKVEALVAAAAPHELATRLGDADRVLAVAHPALEPYTPEAHAAILAETVRTRDPAVVLLGYSSVGLDLAPSLAVRTGRPLVCYCVKLVAAGDAVEAESLVYGGKLRAATRAKLPAIFTVTPGSYAEAQAGSAPAEIVDLAPPDAIGKRRTAFVSETRPPPGRHRPDPSRPHPLCRPWHQRQGQHRHRRGSRRSTGRRDRRQPPGYRCRVAVKGAASRQVGLQG